MFLYLYRGFTKETGELSMIGQKLFNAAVTMARKAAPKQAAIRTFSRTIASKGNGQQRVIVSGFGGPNLDADTHFKMLDYLRKFNYRPVVKGFNQNLQVYKGIIGKKCLEIKDLSFSRDTGAKGCQNILYLIFNLKGSQCKVFRMKFKKV